MPLTDIFQHSCLCPSMLSRDSWSAFPSISYRNSSSGRYSGPTDTAAQSQPLLLCLRQEPLSCFYRPRARSAFQTHDAAFTWKCEMAAWENSRVATIAPKILFLGPSIARTPFRPVPPPVHYVSCDCARANTTGYSGSIHIRRH